MAARKEEVVINEIHSVAGRQQARHVMVIAAALLPVQARRNLEPQRAFSSNATPELRAR